MDNAEILAQLPAPPAGSVFRLLRVEDLTHPHPYCITAKHVAVASDHHGGMLDKAAIEDAERRGAECETCRALVKRRRQDRVLRLDEHVTEKALVIVVPQNRDLNAVAGLHAYLLAIKEQAEALGVKGFMFPTEAQAA